MLKKLTTKTADLLCRNGLIEQEEKEIYLFGIETALLKVIHYATMLLIGLCFGMVWQTAVFLLAYTVLRDYAGGYHADSRMRCYLISWLMMLSVLLIVQYCPAEVMFWTSAILLIPLYLLIFSLAPVGNINKPLDEIEQKRYGKTARIILSIEEVLSALFLFFNVQISFVLCLGLFCVSIMLVCGKFKYAKELAAQ